MSVAVEFETSSEVESVIGLRGDPATAVLRMHAMTWRDLLATRLALTQRHAPDDLVAGMKTLEDRALARLKRELRRHPLWPWLSQFPGLGGGHTALLLAAIGDPHRFPGQKCSVGHYHAPGLEVGSPCPLRAPERTTERDVTPGGANLPAGTADPNRGIEPHTGCPGVMLPPRTTTGVRSLWHYLGLHVDAEGRAPRKRKGQRTTWDPALKASLLGPMGLADHIVRQRTPIYRDRYDEAKERLARERGVVDSTELDCRSGLADLEGTQVDVPAAIEGTRGLRPFEIDARARKIAVKAFVGDLLTAWKTLDVSA